MGCHCDKGCHISLIGDGVAGCQGLQGRLDLLHAVKLCRCLR